MIIKKETHKDGFLFLIVLDRINCHCEFDQSDSLFVNNVDH